MKKALDFLAKVCYTRGVAWELYVPPPPYTGRYLTFRCRKFSFCLSWSKRPPRFEGKFDPTKEASVG